jgi:protein-tyrosine phosphatase
MIPLVDIHCHLLAGLDDGPKTAEDALEMCRIAYEDGTRWICAGAHQNEHYPLVTPDVIRSATAELKKQLKQEGLGGLVTVPCAEIAAHNGMEEAWQTGQLLSVADGKRYLLVEMPNGIYVKLHETVRAFAKQNLYVILAHPERQAELLYGNRLIEELIDLGALVQVSAESVTNPKSKMDEKLLREWFKRGIVHAMGSDGHSPRRRLPQMGDAYKQVCRWAGVKVADRVFYTNGMGIMQGWKRTKFSKPEKPKKAWYSRFFTSRA